MRCDYNAHNSSAKNEYDWHKLCSKAFHSFSLVSLCKAALLGVHLLNDFALTFDVKKDCMIFRPAT